MGATLGSGVKGSDPGVRGRGTPGFGSRGRGGDHGFRFLPHPPPPASSGSQGHGWGHGVKASNPGAGVMGVRSLGPGCGLGGHGLAGLRGRGVRVPGVVSGVRGRICGRVGGACGVAWRPGVAGS